MQAAAKEVKVFVASMSLGLRWSIKMFQPVGTTLTPDFRLELVPQASPAVHLPLDIAISMPGLMRRASEAHRSVVSLDAKI